MKALAAHLGFLLVSCTHYAYAADVCPKPAPWRVTDAGELSWATSAGKFGDKTCTRQQIEIHKPDAPLTLEWPEAGILSASAGGRLTSSFCCFEGSVARKSVLEYGAPAKRIETSIDEGIENDSDNYPDLIEDDARTMRSAYAGKLWDGTKFVEVDIELRAAASNPHLNQSVFQFVLIDRSPQRLSLNWDLLTNLRRSMEPYYTGSNEGGARQDTYVFFGKQRPAPAGGVVELKTPEGKLLARFRAAGFAPVESAAPGKR